MGNFREGERDKAAPAFQRMFRRAAVQGADAEWFPMWLERYANHLKKLGHSEILVKEKWRRVLRIRR